RFLLEFLDILFGLGLFLGLAAQEAVGGPVGADADLAAEPLHGAAAGLDARGLVQVVGQFFMGPVGAVKPLLGRSLDDPAFDFLVHRGGDLGLSALGLARSQAIESLVEVGIGPALHGARRRGQI